MNPHGRATLRTAPAAMRRNFHLSGCSDIHHHRSRYGHGVDLRELQQVIDDTYGDRDRDRGVAPTVAWLCEEIGELAQAVRKGTPDQIAHEFSDVLAWLATLANQVGVDLTDVVDRYRDGCPKCAALPCAC